MSTLRPKTRTEKRQAILQAAAALCVQFGPVKTSVADIARESGMSAANIYNFFESRDAILEALGSEHLSGLEARILIQIEGLSSSWDRITSLFLVTAGSLRDHLENEKDILQLQALERRNRWRFVSDFHDFIRFKLESLIRSGVDSGEFGPIDPAWAAAALFGCLTVAVDPLQLRTCKRSEHEMRIRSQLDLLRRAFR